MSVNPAISIRKLLTLPHTLVEKIKDYRFEHRFNSEAEAVRHLIERGLRRVDVPLVSCPDENTRPASIPGPYPWEQANLENVTKDLNVSLPAQLKLKMDWLVSQSEAAGRPIKLKSMVADVLTAHVEAALRAKGVDLG